MGNDYKPSNPVRLITHSIPDTEPIPVKLSAGPTINIGDVELLAGTAHIGQTSLDQALPAGTNNIGDVDLASAIPAGEAHMGSVGQHRSKITGSVQRPNDTTPYTARDVVGTAVTANITLTNVARVNGGGGMIFKTRVVTDANKATKPTFELWIFDTAPANVADNAAFAPSDAEMLTVQAVIPLSSGFVGNAGADAAGNYILISDTVPFSFKCTALTRNLYAVLVITNGYTPVAQETFNVILDVSQD